MDGQLARITEQKDVLINEVKERTHKVKLQADALHELLDFIDEEVSAVLTAIEAEKQDPWKIRSLINRLDMVESMLRRDMETNIFSDLTKRVESLEANMSRNNAQMSPTVEKHENQLLEVHEKLKDISDVIEDHSARLSTCDEKIKEVELCTIKLDGQVQDLTSQNVEFFVSQESKFDSHDAQLASLQADVNNFIDNQGQKNRSLADNVKKVESEFGWIFCIADDVRDLPKKFSSEQVIVKNLQAKVSENEKQIKELSEKSLEVERNRTTDLVKIEDMDGMFQQLCQLVADNIQPLRSLQDILNKQRLKLEERDNMFSQIDSLSVLVSYHSDVMSRLESKVKRTTIGFTAYCPSVVKMAACSEIKEFTDVRCNEGNCYDKATGIFTASHEGLYFASVTLRQRKDGMVDVHVVRCSGSGGRVDMVCKTSAHPDKRSSFGAGVVKMAAGDTLYVKTVNVSPEAYLSQYSSFTCFLIG